ncbi:hypothetical protein HPB52_024077 [Rhipicephalus sanguineus]|uniref:DDE-1 domain-containing protein n=1 Tax=Rhipicephalus sanguineus TaxID=34632 RepID=A0A9D4PPX2_RHISA|nr:hypothetical protein HPB52_024077 [Rhipicephalus sanguineus]
MKGSFHPKLFLKERQCARKKFPQGIIVQEKGWMFDALVIDWLKTVWQNRPGVLLRCKTRLEFDSFRGHLANRVKAQLADCQAGLAVIPGGLTSVLQPLDVCINRPFVMEFRQCSTEWMASGNHETTLTVETIAKSFKVMGLSNVMDGIEDDQLWECTDEVSSSNNGESADELSSSDSD